MENENLTASVYSEKTLLAAAVHKHMGRLTDADGYGRTRCGCDDDLEIWLNFDENGRVKDAAYMTEGCLPSVAAGSALCSLCINKTVKELMNISAEDLDYELGGLPKNTKHTLKLALDGLHECVQEYLMLRREPWRKGYRKRAV